MTLIRKWALAVCSALLLTNYLATTNAQNINTLDPTQVYNTVNLVNNSVDPTSTTSTWQNVGLWNQGLPCWGPGGPVYCGPQPYFNNGSFNFSYGYTDVYQLVNIAAALPNSGTGLRVNGFNFGFMAKNGNGWDNGQQDYLVAYVNIYDSKNNLAQSYNYGNYTNQQYGWTAFNFSETFATPYASKDLSTARYGFVGYDTNFWAGPYGPEIYNINFSLKYSVDPCFVDVLSSPNCPGYLDAIAKLTPPTPTPTTTASPTTVTSSPTTTTTDVAQPTTTSSSSVVSAPVITTSTATTSVTPTATNPQPKVGEVTISGSPAKTTMSTSQILAIVRNEQSRISNLESNTVQQAITQAQQQADAAQQDSIAISSMTVSKSQSSAQSATSLYSIAPTTVAMLSTTSSSMSSVNYNRTSNDSVSYKIGSQSSIDDSNKNEGIKFSGANPINNIMNPAPTMPTTNIETPTSSSVNNKVKDNDIAGGVSIASMAKQPIGFENYMGALPDTAFYAPKEIYRNQRIVDNARAQRLLNGASDRLHQQMIEQQYKLGN